MSKHLSNYVYVKLHFRIYFRRNVLTFVRISVTMPMQGHSHHHFVRMLVLHFKSDEIAGDNRMSFRISCMFFASPGALELGFIAECPREVPQLVTTLLSFRSFQSTGSQGVPRFQRFWVHVYPRAMI